MSRMTYVPSGRPKVLPLATRHDPQPADEVVIPASWAASRVLAPLWTVLVVTLGASLWLMQSRWFTVAKKLILGGGAATLVQTLLRTGTVNTERVGNGTPSASCQLSDGTEVFILDDSTGTDFGGTITSYLYYKPQGGVPVLITSWTPWFFWTYSCAHVCCDNLDNLYVSGGISANPAHIGVQAYVKGAGYTWTQKTRMEADMYTVGNSQCMAYWCNTGGGTSSKGHLIVHGNAGGGFGVVICDAGVALAGSGTLTVNQYDNPTMFSNGGHSGGSGDQAGWSYDFSPDGFGATSGLGITFRNMGNPVTELFLGKWSVNSSGVLTSSNLTSLTCLSYGAASGMRGMRLVRLSSNKWAVLYHSSTVSTHWMCTTWSATAQITAPVDCGAPAGMPLNALNMSWDAFRDPLTGKVFVVCPSGTNLVGLGIDCSSGITWDAAITTLAAGAWAGTSTKTRCVKEPRGTSPTWVDIEVYNNDGAGTPNYSAACLSLLR